MVAARPSELFPLSQPCGRGDSFVPFVSFVSFVSSHLFRFTAPTHPLKRNETHTPVHRPQAGCGENWSAPPPCNGHTPPTPRTFAVLPRPARLIRSGRTLRLYFRPPRV